MHTVFKTIQTILHVDASPNWERHLLFIALKEAEDNLQKIKKMQILA